MVAYGQTASAGRSTRRADLPSAAPKAARDSAGVVLRTILDHGPVARSSIARVARLSTASVSGILATLIDDGFVREVPEAAGPPGFGRPAPRPASSPR
ncbi:MarR family transcriptional regulator [Cryptosporangium sp. NPDC048952]|uniref:MarR family transcriptional regulator n=1 Tax=Cryptosporangium sp. NPDC048952 TaxID=3363961 RepID=UPI00372075EA